MIYSHADHDVKDINDDHKQPKYQPLSDLCYKLITCLENFRDHNDTADKKLQMRHVTCIEMIEKDKEDKDDDSDNYQNMIKQVSKNMSEVSKKIDNDRTLIDEHLA